MHHHHQITFWNMIKMMFVAVAINTHHPNMHMHPWFIILVPADDKQSKYQLLNASHNKSEQPRYYLFQYSSLILCGIFLFHCVVLASADSFYPLLHVVATVCTLLSFLISFSIATVTNKENDICSTVPPVIIPLLRIVRVRGEVGHFIPTK